MNFNICCESYACALYYILFQKMADDRDDDDRNAFQISPVYGLITNKLESSYRPI